AWKQQRTARAGYSALGGPEQGSLDGLQAGRDRSSRRRGIPPIRDDRSANTHTAPDLPTCNERCDALRCDELRCEGTMRTAPPQNHPGRPLSQPSAHHSDQAAQQQAPLN
ncbi:hypothetical protein V493_07821, partial [Pseudogymnoascus sp. VKM F-4281 (FW-2241)]